jgi:hypothetical protein
VTQRTWRRPSPTLARLAASTQDAAAAANCTYTSGCASVVGLTRRVGLVAEHWLGLRGSFVAACLAALHAHGSMVTRRVFHG